MSVPPLPPPPPNQPPVPLPPPADGPPPRGPWWRRPKVVGSLIAVVALVVPIVIGWVNASLFDGIAFAVLLVPVGLLVGTLALISRVARPYATGFLLTLGLGLIVLGGVCVTVLSSSPSLY